MAKTEQDRAGNHNSPSSSCLHGRSWATWCFATVHVVEVAEEEVHLANVTLVKDIEYAKTKHFVKVKETLPKWWSHVSPCDKTTTCDQGVQTS